MDKIDDGLNISGLSRPKNIPNNVDISESVYRKGLDSLKDKYYYYKSKVTVQINQTLDNVDAFLFGSNNRPSLAYAGVGGYFDDVPNYSRLLGDNSHVHYFSADNVNGGSGVTHCVRIKDTNLYTDYVNLSGSTIRIPKQSPKTIDESINAHINHPKNKGDAIEGKVADCIRKNTKSHITDFANKVKGKYSNQKGNLQTWGDIDVATETQFFEIKASIGDLDIKQLEKYKDSEHLQYFSVDEKEVIVYIDEPIEMTPKNIEKLEQAKKLGATIVNNLDDLRKVIK